MPHEAQHPQTISPAELMHAAEAVATNGRKRVVQVHGTPLSITQERAAQAERRATQPSRRRRKSGIITADDPLFRLAGIGDSGIEGGISGHKHEYIGTAMRHT